MQKRIAKVLSVTTSITTTLFVSGAASFAPVHAASPTINDGDIFRASNDYKVYIAKFVGAKKFKRWFVGPQMFGIYKHLSFAQVKEVDPSVAASFTESKLVRVDGTQEVWHIGNAVAGQSAQKQWIPTLAAFQAGGFDWDQVYIINSAEGAWYSMGANYDGSTTNPTPSTTPTGGTISASLAVDNPAGAVIADTSIYNPVLKMALAGGPATITGITLTKYGLISSQYIKGVSVWDSAGKRHGAVVTSISSDNKVTVGFGSDPIVMNGAMETLTIRININGASSGTVYFGVAAASDIASNGTVGGAFPLMGNLFTMSSATGTIGEVWVAPVTAAGLVGEPSSSTDGNMDIGDIDKEIAKFKFTAGANEDIQLENLVLYIEGDITESKDLLNWRLYDPSNNVLATAEKPVDRYVTFKLASPYKIEKGLNRTLSVKVNVMDGANRWVRASVQNDYDVMAKGLSTGAYLLPKDSTGSTFDNSTDGASGSSYFKVRKGTMTVTKTSDSQSNNVSVGASDALLAKFTLRASGEGMEVRKMDLYIAKGGSTNLTGNVSIRSADGLVTYATIAASDANLYLDNATTPYDLSTYIQLTSNVDKVIAIYGNVSSSAVSGDSYQAKVRNLYVKRISSIDYIYQPVNTSSIAGTEAYTSGNTLGVQATEVTLAKNSSMGDVTVPPGMAGAKLASFNVQGGTAEDTRITNVILNNEWSLATSVTNLVLKVNGVQQGSAIATPGTTFTFSTSISVPKSTTVQVDVFGDVKSDVGLVPGSRVQLRFNCTTASGGACTAGSFVSVVGNQTSNSITRPSTVSTLNLQNVTFGAGALTISKDSSSPTEQILTAGTNGLLMGNWKFEARNEDLTLRKITFALRKADGTTTSTSEVSNFGTLTLKEGSVPVMTGSLVGTDVIFNGLNIVIPSSGYKTLSLYADLTGSSAQDPGSVARWTVKTDNASDLEVTGTNGRLEASVINGASSADLAASSRTLYHNAKPVISAASDTPSGTRTPQQNDTIFRFTVANTGTRDITIGSVSTTVSMSNGVAGYVDTFELFEGGTKLAASATSIYAYGGSVVNFTLSTFQGGALDLGTISAGATRTFTLKANTANIKAGVAGSTYVTLSTQIAGSTGYNATVSDWNDGSLQYSYTPVNETVARSFSHSDSYPVSGGTLSY